MNYWRRPLEIFSTAALLGLLVACSPANEGPTAGQMAERDQPMRQHSFECSAPELVQGVVKSIHFDGERNSEETKPYVGAFSSKTIAFKMKDGSEQTIKLNEPVFFNSEKKGQHDGCNELTWHSAGPFAFVTFWGGGGNPYPAQQVFFLDKTSQTFFPVERLHPLVGRDFVEFEKGDCIAELRHGDGLVLRTCFQDTTLVVKNVLLEEQYQANAWHTFLCDFPGGGVGITEYRVKSTALDEATEFDPPGNRQKMLNACALFQRKFNQQATPVDGRRSTN